MGLLASLTYRHLEVESRVDEIRKLIEQARRARHDAERVPGTVLRLKPAVMSLNSFMEKCFQEEREHLFPRTARVLGPNLEEVVAMQNYHAAILDTLHNLIDELPSVASTNQQISATRLAYIELLFDEFYSLYEEYCRISRDFYELYSTILFPGGATTD